MFSLSVAVTLAMPPFAPGVEGDSDLPTEEQRPLVGDWVPVQGHVEVEVPAPQIRLGSEKSPAAPEDMEQSQRESLEEVEVKVVPHEKVEQEGVEAKVRPEVKVEQTFVAEQEVKEEQEVKVEQEVKEPEVNVEQEVKEEQVDKVEQEVKEEVDKVEQEVKEPEVNVEQEVKEEQVDKVEQEVKDGQSVWVEQELKAEQEGKPEPQVKVDLELTRADSDLKVESEVKVEQDVQLEPELIENPMFDEEFQVQMNLEVKDEPDQEDEERHMDMERNYEIMNEPVMESEPQDNVGMFGEEGGDAELYEIEKSLRAAFQSQNSVFEPLSEEEGLVMKDEEPIMELDSEMGNEPFQYQEAFPDAVIMGEGPALDFKSQQMS